MKVGRYILPAVAVVGIIFGIFTVLTGSKAAPVAAAVVEPARPPFPHFVAGAGIVEASTENIAIASPVGGVVQQVLVKVGDKVATGQPLFMLDDRELKAQRLVRAGTLEVAKAQREESRTQFALWRSVSDKRAVSEEEFIKRRFAVDVAEAQVTEAQAEVQSIDTLLDRLIVRAPVDATVLQVKVRVGEFAPAQVADTPLMLLGNVDVMHVRVDIDESDAWRVKAGAEGRAFLRGNKDIASTIQFVRFEPYVVPKRSLTGASAERVDTRVLQVIYKFDPKSMPVYVGQLMDVFIAAEPLAVTSSGAPGSLTAPVSGA